jgi:hypothetical protein
MCKKLDYKYGKFTQKDGIDATFPNDGGLYHHIGNCSSLHDFPNSCIKFEQGCADPVLAYAISCDGIDGITFNSCGMKHLFLFFSLFFAHFFCSLFVFT